MFIVCHVFAANKTVKQPKLVVGIVVDQMRYDFLYRYANRYGNDGFNRLLRDGNSCENMFINYLPSYTAPGHTCIYTGSVPAIHGIASNEWIDQYTGKGVYCTDDSTVKNVGGTPKAGKMSPRNLLSSTITDELRLSTNFRSKTISISVKDRASILPGGHTANAAYWLDDTMGVFMSSNYYMKELPQWVSAFNQQELASKYLKGEWNLLYAPDSYLQSTSDANNYEGKFSGEKESRFPHKVSSLKRSDIRKTPFGNSIVFDFAREALQHEQLGKNSVPDFLCLSFSSTDYVGHMYGPNSIEIEDTYLRFDAELSDFLHDLDETVGAGNYTLFLTADHGVAHNPQFLIDQQVPAGYFYGTKVSAELNQALKKSFGSDRLIKQIGENYIWLNHALIDSLHANESAVRKAICGLLKTHPEIQFAIDMEDPNLNRVPMPIREMIVNGHHATRSGDILLILEPAWLDAYATTGTTHGTWNPYDTHIPMLWYGWGIQKGRTIRQTSMTDISATLATLLHIQMPNGCIGQAISEVINNED